MRRLQNNHAVLIVAVAALGVGASLVQAGDAIILPRQTTNVAPITVDSLSTRTSLKSTTRLPSADPQDIDGLVLPPRQTGPRKRTEQDKKRLDERDERANWLLLKPGELTGKYERSKEFSGRKDELFKDDKGTEKRPRDYMFHRVDGVGDEDRGENPTDPKAKGAAPSAGQKASAATGNGSDFGERKKSPTGPSARKDMHGRELGLHTASQFDMSGYLDASRMTDREDSPANVQQSPLGGSAAPVRTPQQQARLDEFRQFLNRSTETPQGSGFGDNSKLSTDLSKPPPTTAPRFPDNSLRLGSGNLFTPSSDNSVSAGSRSLLSPSASDLNAPRAGAAPRGLPAPPTYNSSGQQPLARPSVLRPTVLEIPQRRW